jgi:hypothetical protein
VTTYESELRDMFAAHAMAALMNNVNWHDAEPEDIAAAAYEQADAMLVARKTKEAS